MDLQSCPKQRGNIDVLLFSWPHSAQISKAHRMTDELFRPVEMFDEHSFGTAEYVNGIQKEANSLSSLIRILMTPSLLFGRDRSGGHLYFFKALKKT